MGHAREQSLFCRTGDRVCAIPLAAVVETMRPLPTAAVPDTAAFVAGLAVIRGAPTPVVDLGRLLGGHEPEAKRFVTVRTGDRTVALRVGDVLGIGPLPRVDEDSVPPLLQSIREDHVTALGVMDGALLLVLGASHLVPDEVWGRIQAGGS